MLLKLGFLWVTTLSFIALATAQGNCTHSTWSLSYQVHFYTPPTPFCKSGVPCSAVSLSKEYLSTNLKNTSLSQVTNYLSILTYKLLRAKEKTENPQTFEFQISETITWSISLVLPSPNLRTHFKRMKGSPGILMKDQPFWGLMLHSPPAGSGKNWDRRFSQSAASSGAPFNKHCLAARLPPSFSTRRSYSALRSLQ